MSLLRRYWRALLFFVFVIGFLISAPLVVLYTAGYRYQLGSIGVLKTGILSVTSLPRAATVTLDNIPSEKKTPAVIDTLLPQDTLVRVEKAGYSTWEKRLPIESGNTTFAHNIILFLTGTATPLLNIPTVTSITPSHGTSVAYVTREDAQQRVFIFDPTNNTHQSVWQQSTPHTEDTPLTLSWSPDDTYLLIQQGETYPAVFTRVRLRDGVTDVLAKDTTRAWWDVQDDHTLFFLTRTLLHASSSDTDLSLPPTPTAETAMRFGNRLAVVQSTEQSIVSIVDEAGVASILAYLPMGSYQFVPAPDGVFLLQETTRHRLILLDPAAKNPLQFDSAARVWNWNATGTRLVLSDGFEIAVFSRETRHMQTISRLSDPITSIAWHPLADMLLYSQPTHISALELDDRDHRITTRLVEQSRISHLWITPDGRSLFFLGAQGETPEVFKRVLEK